MPDQYRHVYAAVMDHPWALLPEKLAAIVELVELRARGEEFTADQVRGRIGNPKRPQQSAQGSVAVLPIYGVMAQRMNLMSEISGGTSTELVARAFQDLVADPQVGAIVLDIDSPGGDVFGTAELADVIYRARGEKPIVGVANSMAASAAYWVASQADELVVTPSGQIGSIGVYTAHRDVSRALEKDGMKITLISAGKHKVEDNPYEPLTADARAAMQQQVDMYYGMFLDAVARGRGVKVDDVRSGFGQGRIVGAREAVRVGMADRVGTLQETVERYAGSGGARGHGRPSNSRADIDWRRERLDLLTRQRSVSDRQLPNSDLERRRRRLELAQRG